MPGIDADRPNMYVLLGVQTDISADRLRYTYEQHVADAARMQDHRRLLRLSRAFDALPRSVRLAMYPKTSSATGGRQSTSAAEQPTPRVRRSKRRRTGLRQPVSTSFVVGSLTLVLLFGAAQFARKTHLFGGHSSSVVTAAQPQPETVDVQAIALALNRQRDRDDIVCSSETGVPSTELTCRASDGMTWAVDVVSPPDRFTATITRGSTFEQSARFDAWSVAQGVRECQQQFGTLPPSVSGQSGRARLSCGGGVMTSYLKPGNSVDYRRVGPHRFTVRVTASNGDTVSYRSGSGTYLPSRCANPAC